VESRTIGNARGRYRAGTCLVRSLPSYLASDSWLATNLSGGWGLVCASVRE
jgi:hypothetical protein